MANASLISQSVRKGFGDEQVTKYSLVVARKTMGAIVKMRKGIETELSEARRGK